MITIFKTIQNNLQKTNEFDLGSWINVESPTSQELEKLSQKLNIPLDFLTDPLDIDERARIEVEDGCILIVLRIPRFDEKEADIQFTTLPLGIIIIQGWVITICFRDTPIILDFILGKVRGFSTQNRSRFILQIFLKAFLLYLNYLKEIDKRSTAVENELHKAMKNEELIKLLNLEKSLVFFITSLKSNELMLKRLQGTEIIKMDSDDKDLLEDVIIENQQALDMSNIYSNILSGMMDAFASVISNNLNVVMKFLTAITIILTIPTLVASIYGMNVKLPFQNSPYAFLITLGISFSLSAIAIVIFIKRKWF